MKSLITLAALLVSLATPAFAEPVDAAPTESLTMACYAVAPGRASVPVRENYFTYSPIVGSISAGSYFYGERVAGENKVLVYTPHAGSWIGIARFTFTTEVPLARCAGARLYAPLYTELMSWVTPLPGEVAAPQPPTQVFTSWGCFETANGLTLTDARVPAGGAFFGARGEVDGHYTTQLAVLDGATGESVGTTSTRHVTQVPLVQCAAGSAFRVE